MPLRKLQNKLKGYQERYKKALARQDGRCTMFFNGWWKDCCQKHDIGCADAAAMMSESERKRKDIELMNCGNKKFPLVGSIMYIGIRYLYLNPRKLLFKKPKY